MSWHGAAPKGAGRFDLLLLEEGEYFFEDYSAVRAELPKFHAFSPSPGALANLRQVRGRIKVCSRGIMFDPEDSTVPVACYTFKAMRARCPQAFARERDGSSPGLGAEMFVLEAGSVTEMREDGAHHPYRLVTPPPAVPEAGKARGGSEGGSAPSFVFLFALLHTQLDKVMPLVRHLWNVSQQVCGAGGGLSREAELLAPLLRQRHLDKFDSSLLVDFSEKPLLRGAMLVTRIIPLVKHPGCLFITSKRVYFQPAPLNNVGDPVVRFRLRDITGLHRRRYLLRQCGLEFFFGGSPSARIGGGSSLASAGYGGGGGGGGESLYLSFNNSQERDYVYNIIASQPDVVCASPVGSGGDASKLSDVQARWRAREISNFDYLCFLNSEADRSRNDLTQYPVFPWVLSDYTSKVLDLDDPGSFRDLSKPVGALNPERLRDFKERFRTMPPEDKEMGLPPPFLYGTHYSVPGYVLFYVVRQAPEYMLRLQNGKFDAPDRLFNSIAEAWQSVLSNPADLKELIPEFYDTGVGFGGGGGGSSASTGEFLLNVLDLDMGVRQKNRKRVHDVELPPWAQGSPRVFVEKMREALESEHVSLNLHKWIDLIFGSKQKGRAAQEADNLFYWLTYEGAVDLDSKDLDPIQKQSYEVQIGEFGQCPKQLFTEDHPRRSQRVVSGDTGGRAGVEGVAEEEAEAEPKPLAAPAAAVSAGFAAAEVAASAEEEEESAQKAAVEEARRRWHEKQRVAAASAVQKAEEADTGAKRLAEEQRDHIAREEASKAEAVKAAEAAKAAKAEATKVSIAARTTNSGAGGTTNASGSASSPSSSSSSSPSPAIQPFARRRPGAPPADLYSVVANLPAHMQAGSLTTVRKKIHRSAITAMCVGKRSTQFGSNFGKPGSDKGGSSRAGINSLSSAKMLLYSTSEDTSLKLHTWNGSRGTGSGGGGGTTGGGGGTGADAGSAWAQRRSVQLNSLSLSSCVLRQMSNESIEAAVVGSWDNHIYVYSVECGRMQHQLVAHDDAVACLAQSRTHLASGSWDSTVKLWQWTPQGLSRDPLLTVFDHDTQVNCVAMMNADASAGSDNLVLSGGDNGMVALHDSREGGAAAMICDTDAPVSALQWCADGSSFVVCSTSAEGDYGTLQVHDVRMNWGCAHAVEMDYPGKCMSIVESRDASSPPLIVAGCVDGRARCFELAASEMLSKWEVDLEISGDAITAMAATGGGGRAGQLAFGTATGNSVVLGMGR